MSDYMHKKQVLYPVTKELLDRMAVDENNFEDRLFPADTLEMEYFVDYSGTGDSNKYLAYELYSGDYGEESGEFGRSRFLKPSEQEKYKKIFSKAIPEEFINPSLFKYVDYCYYNCTDCDDYYVKKDSFEEEI